MRRYLAGMLIVFAGALLATPTAGAVEIPPTAECTNLMRDLLDSYSPERYAKLTKEQQKAVDRHMLNQLHDGGCISNVEPLLKNMPAKPFSEECASAAENADDYWSTYAATVGPASMAWRKATKSVRLRERHVIKRIRALRRNGASARRVAPLVKLRKALAKREARIARPYVREFMKVARTFGFNSYLIVAEFMALRCVPKKAVDYSRLKGPAAKVLEKHALTVFVSMLMVTLDDDVTVSSISDASRGASASSAGSSKGYQLPLGIAIP